MRGNVAHAADSTHSAVDNTTADITNSTDTRANLTSNDNYDDAHTNPTPTLHPTSEGDNCDSEEGSNGVAVRTPSWPKATVE